MIELIKKHWITSLGIVFIFSSFIYFLKIAMEHGWLPPEARVFIGIGIGISMLYGGYSFFAKKEKITGEVMAGLGVSVIYATFTFISFSDSIHWPFNVLFISVLAITSIVSIVCYIFEMRALMFISAMGGLISPLLIKAEPQHDLMLFSYVLIINISSIYISITKKWTELRILSFIATGLVYATYYIVFEPEAWGKPFFYVCVFFIVYMIGINAASWKEKDMFQGLNMYMSLINALIFVSWSIYILSSFNISFTIPVLITGLVFIASSIFVYVLSGNNARPSLAYFLLGIILAAIASSNIGEMRIDGMHYVITTAMWLMIVAGVHLIGRYMKNEVVSIVSLVAWGALLIYWFSVAWDVEWLRLFGLKYIPFLNPGALVWVAMAWFGFYVSRKTEKENVGISNALAVVANIIVGGLFTVQIQNLWDAYTISFLKVALVQSIAYLIYAMLLFIYGSHIKSILFRIFGSAALVITAIKVFFFDLQGDASFHKVVFLFIMGALTLSIAYINKKWSDQELPSDKLSEEEQSRATTIEP